VRTSYRAQHQQYILENREHASHNEVKFALAPANDSFLLNLLTDFETSGKGKGELITALSAKLVNLTGSFVSL
jgi:hypothetical protein